MLSPSGTLADEPAIDCVEVVREQRVQNPDITRSQIMTALAECRGGLLEARIAEQELIIVALGEQIQQLNLRIDDQARIIDATDQEIARIETNNGQLIIRRAEVQAETAASQARQEEMLQEAKRILQSLATQ